MVDSSKRLIHMFKTFLGNTNPNVHFGIFVTGDQRIRDNESSYRLNREYNALAVDQEIAATAHVCHLNNIEFFGLKSVSDKANNNTINDQIEYKKIACKNSCKLLIDFFEFRQRKGLFV